MKALIVDDSRAVRLLISRILGELGFATFEAENGREALDELERSGRMDLVVVDWNMPVMDGYAFVCAVRSSEKYQGMPLLMVTTETEMDRVVRALEAGVTEYLMKPFSREDMCSKLDILGLQGS